MNQTNKPLSFLIAGLGSIGQRHLRNLIALGIEDIALYRTGKGTLESEDLNRYPVFHDLPEALAGHPAVVVVSNPTSMHMDVALKAAETGCHLFLEKPISHSLDRIDALRNLIERNCLKVFVGFQFRFHPGLIQIKKWIDGSRIGRITSIHAHWGEYLPAWHPWEDYRKGYSARKEMGGGVVLTLCHPLDYLRWLIGEIRSVSAETDTLSEMEIDIEDTAAVLCRFESGTIGTVYLDYIERPSRHELLIIGTKGSIVWNNTEGGAILHDSDRKEPETFHPPAGFERNTMFLNEMTHFIDCIREDRDPDCGLTDGIRVLEIIKSIKESVHNRRRVDVISRV